MLADAQQEISAYGDPLYDTKSGQGALLLQVITRFSSSYRDAIDGKLTELSVNELYGGARINYIFNEVFGKCLDQVNPTEGLSANDIRTAIRNATVKKYISS
jgi:dynamin 1-like protein